MTRTPFFADQNQKAISVELSDGRGFDAYSDGSIIAWDGSGAFTRCEATGNLQCFSDSIDVAEAIRFCETQLGVAMDFGVLI